MSNSIRAKPCNREQSLAFLSRLLLLSFVTEIAQTNGIKLEPLYERSDPDLPNSPYYRLDPKFSHTPEIAQKKEWFVLFTTPEYAALGERGRVHCGGALVARDMVLTAAHCFDKFLSGGESLARYTAWVGRQAMSPNNGDIGRAYALEGVFPDSRYNTNDGANLHDYALVKIVEFGPSMCDRGALADNNVFANYGENRTVKITDAVLYEDGPSSDYCCSGCTRCTGDLLVREVGDLLDLYGFGRYYLDDGNSEANAQIGPTSPFLLRGNATLWPFDYCRVWYEFVVPDPVQVRIDDGRNASQLCVGPALSCFGDSGGALVLGDYIIGIASYFVPEAPEARFDCYSAFEFYTDIEYYKDDIFITICDISAFPPTSCRTGKKKF